MYSYTLNHQVSSLFNSPIALQYQNQAKERDPDRTLHVENPEKYHGQLGVQSSPYQAYSDKVFFVNGRICKADGNFLDEFQIYQVSENLFMGSYPLFDGDVNDLQQAGVTAILNIQTEADIVQRGINQHKLGQFYSQRGI